MLNIYILEDSFFHQARLEAVIQDFARKTSHRYRCLEVFRLGVNNWGSKIG